MFRSGVTYIYAGLFFLLTALLPVRSFAQWSGDVSLSTWSGDVLLGTWLSEDKRCKAEIYASGGKYYGKIIWIFEQTDPETGKPKTDKNNPNPEKRNRPLIGLMVLWDFEFIDGFWQGGYIYNPQTGKVYDCDIWLEGNDTLVMRGYWGILYHTEKWTRVE